MTKCLLCKASGTSVVYFGGLYKGAPIHRWSSCLGPSVACEWGNLPSRRSSVSQNILLLVEVLFPFVEFLALLTE